MDRQKVILIVALIIMGAFIIFDVSGEILQRKNQFHFSQGAEAAVFTILNTASQCLERGVEIPYQNQTFRLHWEGCLIK